MIGFLVKLLGSVALAGILYMILVRYDLLQSAAYSQVVAGHGLVALSYGFVASLFLFFYCMFKLNVK